MKQDKTIDKLLNKKKPTGKDIGKIEVINMAVMFKESLAGEKPQGILPLEDISELAKGITDRNQISIFNGYIYIHRWLTNKYNIAQTQFQQAQLQYRTLERYISQAILTEDIFQYVEKLPALVTRKQYDDIKQKKIIESFTDENGNERTVGVYQLIDKAVMYYLDKLQKDPTAANPLKVIRKKYVSLPVESEYIKSAYNKLTGAGYYTIEDGSGRRSDQMSAEEWKNAVKETCKEVQDLKDISRLCRLLIVSALQNAKPIEISRSCKEKVDRELITNINNRFTWTYYEEAPADLTKWDIIEQTLLAELYPADLKKSGDRMSAENFDASMIDFTKEFSELVRAILADMDRRYLSKEKMPIASYPVASWKTTAIHQRKLYDMDFYGERQSAANDINIFDGNKRALYNGIAIVRASDLACNMIDENGYYIEPTIESSFESFSLESFLTDSESKATSAEILETARETLLDSLYFLKGYNLAIDMTAEHFEVPQIEIFKADLLCIQAQIKAINDIISLIYKQIKNTDYTDKKLQARKLEVIERFFKMIDYDSVQIPEERIQKARALLENFQAYTGSTAEMFYNLLCVKDEECC